MKTKKGTLEVICGPMFSGKSEELIRRLHRSPAHHTQRLVNQKPAKFHDQLIQIGAQEAYDARCRNCYFIDKKPTFKLCQNQK